MSLEKTWIVSDDTLVIRFQTTSDRLQALQAKKKLFSLSHKIYLDEDLTRLQIDELHKARALVVATRKENKWAVIRDCRAVIRDSPPSWWSHPWSLA